VWIRRHFRFVDVRPHPHIGLSTVTYLFDGEITIATLSATNRRSARAK
jgi:redox-sensitive bicupin YhaK (pirin superfamily)